jgi:hypothetical protein
MVSVIDPTLEATTAVNVSPQSAWPLPATQIPGAHLAWAEWIARQAIPRPSESQESAVQTRPAQLRAVALPDRDPVADMVWPLPRTQQPNARVTWAEWLVAQAGGAPSREPEKVALPSAS